MSQVDKDSSLRSAKSIFSRASQLYPSSRTWGGLGIACYLLKEYENAEDALSEANSLNIQDSQIWTYLAILNLALGRHYDAKLSAAQALKYPLYDYSSLRYL